MVWNCVDVKGAGASDKEVVCPQVDNDSYLDTLVFATDVGPLGGIFRCCCLTISHIDAIHAHLSGPLSYPPVWTRRHGGALAVHSLPCNLD